MCVSVWSTISLSPASIPASASVLVSVPFQIPISLIPLVMFVIEQGSRKKMQANQYKSSKRHTTNNQEQEQHQEEGTR